MAEIKNYSKYLEHSSEVEKELNEGRADFVMIEELRVQLEEEIKAQQAITDSPDASREEKDLAKDSLKILTERFEKNERILDSIARDQSEREKRMQLLRQMDKTTKEILNYPASEEIN